MSLFFPRSESSLCLTALKSYLSAEQRGGSCAGSVSADVVRHP